MKSIFFYYSSFLLFASLFGGCRAPEPNSNDETKEEDTLPPVEEKYPSYFEDGRLLLSNLPPGFQSFAFSDFSQGVVFFGGLDSRAATSRISIFNPEEAEPEQWFKEFVTPLSPRFLSSGSLSIKEGDEYVMFFGGASFVEVTRSRGERLGDGLIIKNPAKDPEIRRIPPSALSPTPRDGHCVVGIENGKFLVLAGDNNGIFDKSMYIYDAALDTWEKRPDQFANTGVTDYPKPQARTSAVCYLDARRQDIVIYGGFNETSGHLFDLWRYNIDSGIWREISISPHDGGLDQGFRRKVSPQYSTEGDVLTLYFGQELSSFSTSVQSLNTVTGYFYSANESSISEEDLRLESEMAANRMFRSPEIDNLLSPSGPYGLSQMGNQGPILLLKTNSKGSVNTDNIGCYAAVARKLPVEKREYMTFLLDRSIFPDSDDVSCSTDGAPFASRSFTVKDKGILFFGTSESGIFSSINSHAYYLPFKK